MRSCIQCTICSEFCVQRTIYDFYCEKCDVSFFYSKGQLWVQNYYYPNGVNRHWIQICYETNKTYIGYNIGINTLEKYFIVEDFPKNLTSKEASELADRYAKLMTFL